MPTMALQTFFGWNLDLPPTTPQGPTKPSYAAWQASVTAFSLLWLLMRPGAAPIARLALTVCQLGFAHGYLDRSDEVPAIEEVLCAAAV